MDGAYQTWWWVLAAGAGAGFFLSPRTVALVSVGLFAVCIAGLIAAGSLGHDKAATIFGLGAMAIPVLGIIAAVGAALGSRVRRTGSE